MARHGKRVRSHARGVSLWRSWAVWTAVLGLVLTLAGTLLANSSSYRPLSFIPSALSRLDERDNAWAKLAAFDARSPRLGENAYVSAAEEGFQTLVDLLARHGCIESEDVPLGVAVEAQMLYGDDSRRIGRYVVTVNLEGESDSRVVAWMEDVRSWIEADRLQWATTYGMPVMSAGLLVSLVGVVAGQGNRHDMKRARSRRHRPLSIILVTLGAVALLVSALAARPESLLSDLASLALILTLLVLVRYAYDTYRIAEITTVPSASLEFVQADRAAPFLLVSRPKNHSRVPLECWCDVHVSVCGKPIALDGFYGGQQPWYLQPYQQPHGVLDLESVVKGAGKTTDELRTAWASATGTAAQSTLRLEVEFWFGTIDGRFASPHFWEGYYFNFDKNVIVLDPHLGASRGSRT